MKGAWLVVVTAAGCGFTARARGDGGVSIDAPGTPDAPAIVDAPPGQVCFGTLAVDRVCYAAADVPGGSHTYQASETIDTGNAATCTGNTGAASLPPGNPCIIAYDTISFTGGGALTVGGPHPVIFLATGAAGLTMSVGSLINVSSGLGDTGAGVLTSCAGATAATQKSGGFGGSFLALGGAGGLGDGDASNDKGVPATVLAMPADLHGGCPGGIGGNNNFVTPALGGGAVALVAHALAIDGLVAASGDGGLAPQQNNAGGNGGGAGGMIVVDAPTITGVGELAAKGGGGGEGRGGNQPTSGTPGYYPANRLQEGLGGSTVTSTGGDGGQGGPRLDSTVTLVETGADGLVGTSTAGGGGGGGAAGLVLATSTLPGSLRSEPAVQ